MNSLIVMQEQYCSCKDGTICVRFFQFLIRTSLIIAKLVCVPNRAFRYHVLNEKLLRYNCHLKILNHF